MHYFSYEISSCSLQSELRTGGLVDTELVTGFSVVEWLKPTTRKSVTDLTDELYSKFRGAMLIA